MCHLLPPQSQHSPGGFGCNLCDRWALPMETQVFSAHQPRLEFAPNCAAWTCGNVWKSYLPTKKINMASGSKHMTWVWSLETVYSLPSTTVSHQCLAVLAAWVSLGRSKRNWRSAAMTRHSNASNWTSQIFQCHHLRYVAFFAHFLNWFLLLIGHPAEVWSDWSMLSFGVCGEMVPTCTNWVLIFTNSKACLWAESLSRWDTWDGPCPGLGKLEETGTIWLHTFSVPMGSYGYLWVLSWQSTHRKNPAPRLFAATFIIWTVLHFYLKIGRNEPCVDYAMQDCELFHCSDCWTRPSPGMPTVENPLYSYIFIYPYIILNEFFISGEFGFQRQTSLQVSWHRFQDCPIYGEFDWHHPQRTAMTSLAAIAGLMMASGIYSGLVTWLVGPPWNFNLEGSRGECAQSTIVHQMCAPICSIIMHICRNSCHPSHSITFHHAVNFNFHFTVKSQAVNRISYEVRCRDACDSLSDAQTSNEIELSGA